MFMQRRLQIVCAAVLLLTLSGCNNDSKSGAAAIQAGQLVSSQNYQSQLASGLAEVSQRVEYRMPSVNGGLTVATAVVMLPKGTAPAGGWPVVAWAHGTTGVADQCAPSLSQDLAGYDGLIAQLLSQGYAVVAPDYEGLGSAGNHPYLNLQSAANSLIYAVKAAQSNWSKLSTSWVAVGHSQGGHAALGASQYALGAGVGQYLGAVAFAPASNLKSTLELSQAQVAQLAAAGQTSAATSALAQTLGFTGLVVAGLRQTESVDYSQVFQAQSRPVAQLAESECFTGLATAFATDIVQYVQRNAVSVAAYPALQGNYATVPAIQTFFDRTEPARVKLSTPTLLLQGAGDTTVPKVLTDSLYQQMETLDSNVNYQVFDTADHGSVVAQGIPSMLTFLDARFGLMPNAQ